MHPTAFWWEAKMHGKRPDYGSMTEAEVLQIYEETYGDECW